MYSVISVTKVKNHSPKNSPVFYLLFVKFSRLARVLLAAGPAVRQRGVLSVAAAARETGGVSSSEMLGVGGKARFQMPSGVLSVVRRGVSEPNCCGAA